MKTSRLSCQPASFDFIAYMNTKENFRGCSFLNILSEISKEQEQRDSDGENEEGKGRKRLRRRDASGNPKANGEGDAKQSLAEDGDGGKEKEETAGSSDVPKRRTSRKKSASSDAVSSDAASLPQGLIGELSEPARADK